MFSQSDNILGVYDVYFQFAILSITLLHIHATSITIFVKLTNQFLQYMHVWPHETTLLIFNLKMRVRITHIIITHTDLIFVTQGNTTICYIC